MCALFRRQIKASGQVYVSATVPLREEPLLAFELKSKVGPNSLPECCGEEPAGSRKQVTWTISL